jgi:hypothetical protein
MRKLLLIGLMAAAPILVAPTSASAWGWGWGHGPRYYGYYGYAPRYYYGYRAPRFHGYFAPRWRYYAPRVYGYRAYWAPRRWVWGGWRRW